MDFQDYYKTLSVAPDADSKTIKTAYRKLARKYHPDVSEHHEAEEKFKQISEAYEVLKDPQKRAQYDELREYGAQPQGSSGGQQYSQQAHNQGDFSDFFSSIFGGGHQSGPGAQGFSQQDFSQQGFSDQGFSNKGFGGKGQDIETDMPIFLEDTLALTSKPISYSLPHRDAQGRVSQVNKTLNVKIPAGVAEGERIRLKGQGGQGLGDAPPGDLYLRIRLVPHPLFDVEAHNLIVTVPLAPWEAALGTSLELPTLSGKIKLRIPANSQTGQRLRIKGKGLVRKDGHGDLYAVLKVVMPDSVSEESKQHWQQLADASAFDPRMEWSK
jgi:curved DNA-binding protein